MREPRRNVKPVNFSPDGQLLVCVCGEKKGTAFGPEFDSLDALAVLLAWAKRHQSCGREPRP